MQTYNRWEKGNHMIKKRYEIFGTSMSTLTQENGKVKVFKKCIVMGTIGR